MFQRATYPTDILSSSTVVTDLSVTFLCSPNVITWVVSSPVNSAEWFGSENDRLGNHFTFSPSALNSLASGGSGFLTVAR